MRREPRKWKYKRSFKFKSKVSNLEPSMSLLGFNLYGLVLCKDTFLEYRQLFTVYTLLRKKFKKKCYIKINVSCILPFTKKPVSSRMGKGKGAWKGFNVFLRKGTVLFEIGGVDVLFIRLALKECSAKLPVRSKIVSLKY